MNIAAKQPNFFLIGAHKAGTTSLYEHLKSHPQIFMSPVKEPGFFSIPEHAARGLNWYLSLFRDAAGETAIGEASTTYALCHTYPDTAQRVIAFAPHAKIIYVVRHPLKRLESGWIQWRSEGERIPQSFTDALRRFPALIDSGRYWSQLNCYRALIPDERILVLFFEDFCTNPRAAVRQCFEFLGVNPETGFGILDEAHNTSVGKREDAFWLALFRRLPAYHKVRDILVPTAIRRQVKQWFTKPMGGRPDWTDESIEFVRDELADEIERFLGFSGRPSDYWSLPWLRQAKPLELSLGPQPQEPDRRAA